MQTLRDAFSAFAPTYGSMFKMLDYKLDISRNQNLPFNSRMLTALAFLPTKDVRGFVAVCAEIRTNFGNVADELLAYFKDTYISNFRLNTPRNNPVFSKEYWNMFHCIDAELPRTNNSVKTGIVASKGICHRAIPVFGSFYES